MMLPGAPLPPWAMLLLEFINWCDEHRFLAAGVILGFIISMVIGSVLVISLFL